MAAGEKAPAGAVRSTREAITRAAKTERERLLALGLKAPPLEELERMNRKAWISREARKEK